MTIHHKHATSASKAHQDLAPPSWTTPSISQLLQLLTQWEMMCGDSVVWLADS